MGKDKNNVHPVRYAVLIPASASQKLPAAADVLAEKHRKEGMNVRVIRFQDNNVHSALPSLQDFKPYYTCFVIPKELGGRAFTIAASRLAREIVPEPYLDTFWGIITGANDDDIKNLCLYAGPLKIEFALDMVGGFNHDVMKTCYSFDETQELNLRVTDEKQKKRNVKSKTDKDFTELFSKLINHGGIQLIMTSGHATENNWASGYVSSNNMFVIQDDFKLIAASPNGKQINLEDKTPKIWSAAGNCLIGNIPDGKSCMLLSAIHCLGVKQFMGYTIETWFGRQGWTAQGMLTEYPGYYSFNQSFHFANSSIVRALIKLNLEKINLNIPSYEGFSESFNQAKIHISEHGVDAKEIAGLIYDRDVVAFYGDPAVRCAIEPFNGQTLALSSKIDGNTLKLTVKTLKDGKWHDSGLYIPYPGVVLPNPMLKSKKNVSADVTLASCFAFVPMSGEFHKGETFEFIIQDDFLTSDSQSAIAKKNEAIEIITKWLDFLPPNSIQKEVVASRLENAVSSLPLESATEIATAKIDSSLVKSYLAWLIAFMPPNDLKQISLASLLENITYAIKARTECPWRNKLNEDLFLRYILPYWCVDEKRDPWRKFFYDKYMKLAKTCRTPSEAVKIFNQQFFKDLNVTYDAEKRPKPNQSSMESIQFHYASCTGLSVILINVCRACAIPARFTGCGAWTDLSGNHSWVEYWDDQWIYEGASSSDPRNRSWVGEKVKKATSSDSPETDVLALTVIPQGNGLSFVLPWNTANHDYPAISIRSLYMEQNMLNTKLSQYVKNAKYLWLYYCGEPLMRISPTLAAKGVELPDAIFSKLQVYSESEKPGTCLSVPSPVH